MEKNVERRPVSRRLHPWIYTAIAGLAFWYLLSVWVGFASSEYTDYLLVIASLFVLGVLALPLIAWRVWRHSRGPGAGSKEQPSFRDWALADFDLGQSRVSGRTAAIEILLPIAAVAFGMTVFAIVALTNR